MFSKKAVVVSTATGCGTRSAMKDVTNHLFYCGVPKILTYGIAVQAMNWEMVKDKQKVKIERDTTRLAKKISSTKKPSIGIKTRFIFKIMAGMQSAGFGSSPIEKEYWAKNGWLGKKRPWNDGH